jgi:hypothetical protein
MGASNNAHPPPIAMLTNAPRAPRKSASIARRKVGDFARTKRAASQSGAENTITKPISTALAGNPVTLRFTVPP